MFALFPLFLALLRGDFGGFDELPEFRILLQGLILLHFETGTKQEVFEGMAVEDAMDDQTEFVALEIDAVIPDPKAMEGASSPLELSELVHLSLHDLLGEAAELAEDLQLKFLGHPRELSRAGRIKDDLKGVHNGSAR